MLEVAWPMWSVGVCSTFACCVANVSMGCSHGSISELPAMRLRKPVPSDTLRPSQRGASEKGQARAESYDIYVEKHGDRKFGTQAPPGAPVPGSQTCQVSEPGEPGIAPGAAGEVTASGAVDPSLGGGRVPTEMIWGIQDLPERV